MKPKKENFRNQDNQNRQQPNRQQPSRRQHNHQQQIRQQRNRQQTLHSALHEYQGPKRNNRPGNHSQPQLWMGKNFLIEIGTFLLVGLFITYNTIIAITKLMKAVLLFSLYYVRFFVENCYCNYYED